jgi:hypothetical protein
MRVALMTMREHRPAGLHQSDYVGRVIPDSSNLPGVILSSIMLNGVDRNTIQHALRDHGRPSACYIFLFGSVKPSSFSAFSSTGMLAAEALLQLLSAVATAVDGSVLK